MPSLGDFSDFDAAADQAEQVEPDTFTFKGETFTVADRVSSIPMMRLAKYAVNGADTVEDPQALVALWDFLAEALAEGEFDRFAKVAHKHKTSDEALVAIAGRLYEVITARPTKGRPSSSAGQPATSLTSKLAASGEELVSPEEAVRILSAAG